MTQPRIDAIAQRLCFLVGVNGSNAEPIRVADWVKIVLTYLQYQGQNCAVRRVFQDQGLTIYTVQLEGGKRIDYQRSDLKLVT